MLLELQNISKSYGAKEAVRNLSLQVPHGVLYGIIGPNGAGKTTTIRMIMNIIAPDSGDILYDGRPVTDSFTDIVGYLPEERGLYKKMTLSEVMIYMSELKGVPSSTTRERLGPWLEKMDLGQYRDKKVEELSKGMAQKLQFITTILHNPSVIILDELFSGLDPINIELIKSILLELKREGKTILFSTHVMEQAEKLCDYICMISRGQKVIDGKLSEVRSRFGTNSIQVEMDGDGAFVRQISGVKGLTEFNNYIELDLEDNADTNAILNQMSQRVKIKRFQIMEPSLYDIFIDLAKIDPRELEGEAPHA